MVSLIKADGGCADKIYGHDLETNLGPNIRVLETF